MIGFVFFVQAVVCILLMIVILMQSGRGGGLTEAFASAENMFGAKTNEVLVRTTIVLAALFLAANLVLAHLSAKRERSLFDQAGTKKSPSSQTTPLATVPVTNAVN